MIMIIKKLLLSKEREIFRDIYHARLEQLQRATHDVDYRYLNYKVTSSGEEYKFVGLKDPLAFLNDIKKGKISIQKVKNTQKYYNKYLNLIRRGNKYNIQRETLNNIDNLYHARDMVIKFLEDYG